MSYDPEATEYEWDADHEGRCPDCGGHTDPEELRAHTEAARAAPIPTVLALASVPGFCYCEEEE